MIYISKVSINSIIEYRVVLLISRSRNHHQHQLQLTFPRCFRSFFYSKYEIFYQSCDLVSGGCEVIMSFLRRSNKTDIYQIINTPKYRFLRILNIQLQSSCHVLLLTSTVFRSERNNSDSILSVPSDQIISDPVWRVA